MVFKPHKYIFAMTEFNVMVHKIRLTCILKHINRVRGGGISDDPVPVFVGWLRNSCHLWLVTKVR
jgi:hypothetical protein